MLTVREPPAALVVCRAVRVADVSVRVHGAELHPVLVLERVARVAPVTGHVQPVAVRGARDAELVVLGYPVLAVYVPEVHPERRAVVSREVVQRLVPEPELACTRTDMGTVGKIVLFL